MINMFNHNFYDSYFSLQILILSAFFDINGGKKRKVVSYDNMWPDIAYSQLGWQLKAPEGEPQGEQR